MDRLIVRPDDPDKLLWWWCDALFMSPPVLLAHVPAITHDKKYLDYMDHEWWLTSDQSLQQEEHLYFRDSRYLTQKQANGKPLFWSRGNGWVMGALVNVLADHAEGLSDRPKYVAQFKEMAARVRRFRARMDCGVRVCLIRMRTSCQRSQARRSLRMRLLMGSTSIFSTARLICRLWRSRGREC